MVFFYLLLPFIIIYVFLAIVGLANPGKDSPDEAIGKVMRFLAAVAVLIFLSIAADKDTEKSSTVITEHNSFEECLTISEPPDFTITVGGTQYTYIEDRNTLIIDGDLIRITLRGREAIEEARKVYCNNEYN